MVKNLPAVRETWVRPLGWEDPLEKGMATHSNILALVRKNGVSKYLIKALDLKQILEI